MREADIPVDTIEIKGKVAVFPSRICVGREGNAD